MKALAGSIAVLCLTLVAGCAGSSQNYTAPAPSSVATERMVRRPFEEAWDGYVAELSKSFFVINNISKDSRIINVSFSTGRPSQFIDCGRTNRTSSHPATGEEAFSYLTADSARYNAGVPGTNVVWSIVRTTRLEGRANIYMAPQGDQTLLRVNAKYVWSGTYSGVSNMGQRDTGVPWTMDFSSSAPGGTGTTAEDTVSCYSTGALERDLLNLI